MHPQQAFRSDWMYSRESVSSPGITVAGIIKCGVSHEADGFYCCSQNINIYVFVQTSETVIIRCLSGCSSAVRITDNMRRDQLSKKIRVASSPNWMALAARSLDTCFRPYLYWGKELLNESEHDEDVPECSTM